MGHDEGRPLGPVAVSQVLKAEGFARLPQRADDERPPGPRPTAADIADVRRLDRTPRHLRAPFGGLFLFLPTLAALPFDRIARPAGLPGSRMIPAGCVLRSLLALKLFGTARHPHVLSAVLDEGLALFAGRNAIPKRSFLTEYSCRIDPACDPKLMRPWFDAMSGLGLERGNSFDRDFHTMPSHGDDALVEKHYVSQRSRRQKGGLAFRARDAATRVFCYANAELRKAEQSDEVLRFARYWKRRTGHDPDELSFDSKLTTDAKLDALNDRGIHFITLRRRSPKIRQEIRRTPPSAGRRIEWDGVSRTYPHPRILDRRITLRDDDGPPRQLTVTDLGHDEPTLILTNQLTRPAAMLIGRSAQRMIVENTIEDGIAFVPMDALSSAVALKVNCDLRLTLMASSLYRPRACRIGRGYEQAKSRHLFRDFGEAMAVVTITETEVQVRSPQRAHNPLLIAAGFATTDATIPWLGGRRLRLVFG